MSDFAEKVVLNVGGQRFETSRKSMKRHPGHLATLEKVTNCSEFFIDRDPFVFRYILNFLRDDRVIIPNDNYVSALLYQESKFYGLDHLARMIAKSRINADGYMDLKLDSNSD